ncbi:carbonic anhydrase [Arthrobacter sp. EpRS66]|nr:carbonic anhydrase [Arthrobacter sp. EpRS66]
MSLPGTAKHPTTGSPPPRTAGHWRPDIAASLVVFLVALPLSLGIATASGAPIMAGLIAAVIGGIVAGSLGGSPLQVSGPAAGLTVIVAGLINQFGWQVTCAITVCAGVLQILFGLSRLGRLALAISPVVVQAMLAGIGATIVLQQVHTLLGAQSRSHAWENIAALPESLIGMHWQAALLGLSVIAVILIWKRLPEKFRKVPAQLVAVAVVTLCSLPLGGAVERINITGNLLEVIALPALPTGGWGLFAIGVVTMALIASVESLLSAVAVDRMQHGPRTNFNRELMGQGAANISSGLLGGLPVTGVIVRSATNVASGAQTRASAVMHGVWVLLFSVFFAPLIMQIPISVLAGLLIVVGIQLIKVADLLNARRSGETIVYLATFATVVFGNLLEGVMLGLALSFLMVLWRVVRSNVHAERIDDTPEGAQRWHVMVEGSCSFLSMPRLSSVLTGIPEGSEVIVDIEADFIDRSVAETLSTWKIRHEATDGRVSIEEHGTAALQKAQDGPPQRGRLRSAISSGMAPWNSWQRTHAGNAAERGERALVRGIEQYHRRHARMVQPDMEELAAEQNPRTFFLTCADSRVIPNLITSSGAGDLFTVRNVGNVVGSVGSDPSVEAALEFAINELGVRHLVICGHSNCGAMDALLKQPEKASSATPNPVEGWLRRLREVRGIYKAGHQVGTAAQRAGYGETDQLAMVNVIQQIEQLAAHPMLAQQVNDGSLILTGLFYDIGTARMVRVTGEGLEEMGHMPGELTAKTAG